MLLSTILRGLFLVGLSAIVVADGFDNFNPSGEGCVDPKGFLSCYDAQVSKNTACVSRCDKDNKNHQNSAYSTCVEGCAGQWLAGNLGCWIQGCWNELYSCAYQLTAIHYYADQQLLIDGNVPVFPPPDSTSDGACVCNLGYIYNNLTTISDPTVCSRVASNTGNFDELDDCTCCALGWHVSNTINACPKNDLSLLDFPNYIATTQSVSSSKDKCAVLDTNPESCVTDYGSPWVGPNYYNAQNLPADQPGTEPLSDLPGDSFTEFGDTDFTLTLYPGFSTVITPAPFVATAGEASGGGSSQSTAVSTQKGGGNTASRASVSGSATKTATASGDLTTPTTTKAVGGSATTAPTDTGDLAAATTTKAGTGSEMAWSGLLALAMITITLATCMLF